MSPTLSAADFAAISPLLILLAGALCMLLIESFAEKNAKMLTTLVGFLVLIPALIASLIAPASENVLFTAWLRFDKAAYFFQILFLSIALGSFLLSLSFFNRFKASQGEYFFLLFSAVAGLIFISSSADFLTLFLGLETVSISLYILCGYMKKWTLSSESAIKYFLMGAMAAAFLLYGIALIYGAVGSTRFDALMPSYTEMGEGTQKGLFLAGIALVTLGLAFKAAIAPFHLWAPDVYEGASTPVTAFMAVGVKAGAFAAFVILFLLFLPNFNSAWNEAISILALITLVYANMVALRQKQLRRFFAYSGISHAGFLLIPIVAGTADAFQIVAFYLVVYALATLGAFSVLLFVDKANTGAMIQDLKGLFSRSPLLALIFTLCLLTLAGIPPTAGFFAKFFVFKAAFQSHYYVLLIVALLTTILSAYYYLRIIGVLFAEVETDSDTHLVSWPATAVALFSFLTILFLSCYPAPLLTLLSFIK
jgi:NADH-quinone oxidoreductase subunit N